MISVFYNQLLQLYTLIFKHNNTNQPAFTLKTLLLLPTGLLVVFACHSNADDQGRTTERFNIGQSIEINDSLGTIDLTPSIYWLEDKSSSLNINNITRPEVLQQFQRNHNPIFNLGFTNSPVWVYLPIKHASSKQSERLFTSVWLLNIGHPQLDEIDIYSLQPNGNINHIKLGDSIPFNQRLVKTETFLTPLNIPEGETTVVLIRVKTSSPMLIPISISSPDKMLKNIALSKTIAGIYFGIMIAMILYNLFIYLSIREKSYLYYVFYVASFSLMLASVSGYSYAYLWPNASKWTNQSVPVLVSLSCFFAIKFSQNFLSIKEKEPIFDRLLNATGLLALTLFATSFYINTKISSYAGSALTLITVTLVVMAGLISLKHKNRPALFFLVAWFFLMPGIFISTLSLNNVIPVNFLTLNAGLVGALMEVILLSLALADRINYLREENKQIHQKSQQQLQEINSKLKENLSKVELRNQLKDQFLSTISHELRTPMNGVEGSLNLITTSNLNKDQQSYLGMAKISAKDMTSLIDSLLYFSEMQSGKLELKHERVEIRSLLNSQAARFRQACRQKGLEFNFHIDKDVPALLKGDADQIALIQKHLIDNAIKFTQNGKVSVNLSTDWDKHKEQHRLSFSVVDTGNGIAEEQLEHIFLPFHQLDGNHNRSRNGLGIGLAISHQIAALMGGVIQVSSELGKGSEFTFILPFEPLLNTHLSTNEYISLDHHPKTILIAEDNPVNQLVLKGILHKLGYITVVANNGEEIPALLASQPVDLIMMDCQMPVVDGYEATHLIRTSKTAYNNVPIIAVTANAMTGDSIRCLTAGMNDYIKKPVTQELVELKVKRWLKNNRSVEI